MRAFSVEVMLEFIEGDEQAKKHYEKQAGSEEDRLGRTFLSIILGSKRRSQEYDELYDAMMDTDEDEEDSFTPSPAALPPDSPLVAEIRKLVNEHGWRAFARALAAFAHNKATQLQRMHMLTACEAWAVNAKKFRGLRKNVQL